MLDLLCPRIALTIGDDCIIAFPSGIENTSPFFIDADDKNAAQEIIDFIARHPKAKISLLADNLAQDYAREDIPPLNFIDRKKLLSRRLRQKFPAARLTASIALKQIRNKALMIGLHERNPVFAWAERLKERFPDISLLPLEGARIASKLMREESSGWAMLVTRNRAGGFRQIVTYKKELAFTRLTPLPDSERYSDAEIIAHDIKASVDYLSRHGLRRAEELSVLIMLPDDIHASPELSHLRLGSVRSLSPAEASRILNLKCAPEENDPHADMVFAEYLLSSARPALSLMLPEAYNARFNERLRAWGIKISAAALAISIALSAVQAGTLVSETYKAQAEAALLSQASLALKDAQKSAAPVTEPLGKLRQALERKRIYKNPSEAPWAELNAMSASKDETFKISSVEWKNSEDAAKGTLTVTLKMARPVVQEDRSEIVAAFERAADKISDALTGYDLKEIKPPYPSLPQESISKTPDASTSFPEGQIILQRKNK